MLQELATDLDRYLTLSYDVVDKEGREISPGEVFTIRFTVRYIADLNAPARPLFTRVALFLEGTAWAEPVDGPWVEWSFPNPDEPMQSLDDVRQLDIPMKAKGTMPFNLPEAIGQIRLHARCVAIELCSRPLTAVVQIVPRAATSDRNGSEPAQASAEPEDACDESAASPPRASSGARKQDEGRTTS